MFEQPSVDAMVKALSHLLGGGGSPEAFRTFIKSLAQSSRADRVHFFKHRIGPGGSTLASHYYEWCAPGIPSQINNPALQSFDWAKMGIDRWLSLLRTGQAIEGWASNFPAREQSFLLQLQGVSYILYLPVFVHRDLYGFLGFDRCRPEPFNQQERELLWIGAQSLGYALEHKYFQQMAEEASDMLSIMDLTGRIRWANSALLKRVGLSLSEVINIPCYRLLHEASNFPKSCPLAQLLRDGKSHEGETYSKRLESYLWTRVFPIHDTMGRIHGVVHISRDISELKRAARNLEEIEYRYRILFEEAQDVMFVLENGRFVDCNAQAIHSLGRPKGEILGHRLSEFAPSHQPDGRPSNEVEQEVLNAALQGKPQRFEWVALNMHGEKLLWDVSVKNLSSKAQGLLLLIARDITHQRSLEDRIRLDHQLQQLAKMEALGRLAGGIAHDFNNLLTAMLGYCELLELRTAPEDPRHRLVKMTKRELRRAARITGQLLSFSRKRPSEPQKVNLVTLIKSMEDLLRHTLGEDICLEFVFADDIWPVQADPTLLEQVILNLAVNAREAMPHGGTLVLEISNTFLKDDHDLIRSGLLQEGAYVRLVARDTGCGISPEHLPHIFEPFFTTKEEGTGLGLSTVYGIVRQAGGHILVQSELGKGTTFEIFLPRAPRELREAAPAFVVKEIPRGGGQTVLVVEDETGVRELLVEMLRDLGYEAMAASNAEEALGLAIKREPDVVLTDVVLPGMGGTELVQRLKTLYPNLPVIYMSGWPDERYGELAGQRILQKPFGRAQLASLLQEALTERRKS